ncbi:hypothetical protein A2U01_0090828 [Trifolium medium]|uniref:Uncharacterized protein n=1 Tax=Trifolium medium TaxID=97028 RepID=A0A392UCW4_9FABA|nr:hypothetical protein [Trifolium medium]
MDMANADAVWDKREWSTEAANKKIESTDVAEALNSLYHDRCDCSAGLS